jgi:hypothetical protein
MGVEGDNRTLIFIYLFYTENPGLATNREVLGDRPTDKLYSSFMGNHSDPTKSRLHYSGQVTRKSRIFLVVGAHCRLPTCNCY